jgi:hypothetical protein
MSKRSVLQALYDLMFQQRYRGNADLDKLIVPGTSDDGFGNPNKILIEEGRPTTT